MRHLRPATSGPGDPPVPAENDPEPISSKRGIQEFYDDPAVVDSYIAVRISEPFNTVLHERQVGFLNQVIGELRPGGHLVLDAQNRLVSLPHRLKQGLHTYKVYDELWLRDELVAELEGAGLVPRRVEGVMRRFTWQRRLNRLRYFRLGSPARLL